MTDERTTVHSRTYRIILLALDAIPQKFGILKIRVRRRRSSMPETSFFRSCL